MNGINTLFRCHAGVAHEYVNPFCQERRLVEAVQCHFVAGYYREAILSHVSPDSLDNYLLLPMQFFRCISPVFE